MASANDEDWIQRKSTQRLSAEGEFYRLLLVLALQSGRTYAFPAWDNWEDALVRHM